MNLTRLATCDFETEPIAAFPDYPPKPVGVSIKYWGAPPHYYAWSHPIGNNCSKQEAKARLRELWRSSQVQLLFHNAPFDTFVAQEHMGLKLPPWHRIHDSRTALFLRDPYSNDFSLKPSAERLLGMKPEEQARLRDWLMLNVPEARKRPSEWGAYISKAPVELVAPYANGDVIRTELLFEHCWEYIVEQEMIPAYEREQRLMPILLENTAQGIRADVERLEKDYARYNAALERADEWLRRRLELSEDANIDSDDTVGEAFLRHRIVKWFNYTTKRKKPSLSKDKLTPDMYNDMRVCNVFNYRNKLSTCLGTFFEPWLEHVSRTGNHIHVRWNQVRGEGGGARTGRMSTVPSLLNVPKEWKRALGEGYHHPGFLRSLPLLPFMRVYLLPDEGEVWGRLDYNQQELRLLAHFEEGDLLARYLQNPRLDIHSEIQENFRHGVPIGTNGQLFKLKLPRDSIKIINFADIYGRGIRALAQSIGVDYPTASKVRKAKNKLLPGIQYIADDIRSTAEAGEPIVTWGQRVYYCQPPGWSEKYQREMTFSHKLLNYLIQGSAAEVTKEAIINYHDHPKREGRFLIAVHDELNSSMPNGNGTQYEIGVLKESMEAVDTKLPMLTDSEVGPSWGELSKWLDT